MVNKYEELTAAELRRRRVLCQWLIDQLRGAWSDDPRAASALAHYRAERALIVTALRKTETEGRNDPPRQRVGLDRLQLAARRN